MSDDAHTRRKRVNSGDTVLSVGRGRPEGFALRWSAEERDAIKARAAEHNMAVGPYMIAAAMGVLPELETDRDRQLAEILERLDRLERMADLGGLG